MGWNYADIKQKTRNITGRPDATMMTDATLGDYINKVYQYVIPKELKIFWGYSYYQFFTQPNVDQYEFDTTSASFSTVNPSVWVDGFPVEWYISPDTFYQDYPQQLNKQTVAQGDGTVGPFSFNVSSFPLLTGSVYVTDGTQVAVDDGAGGFTAPASGTINYTNGNITVTFGAVTTLNANIVCSFQNYMPNRPQGILYYESQTLANSTSATRDATKVFVLRPVPDQVYLVKMEGMQVPAPLTNDADVPFREDLGPLIAYCASLEIFSDYNQTDQYQDALVQYNRYKDISMQDTYETYLYQRSIPAF